MLETTGVDSNCPAQRSSAVAVRCYPFAASLRSLSRALRHSPPSSRPPSVDSAMRHWPQKDAQQKDCGRNRRGLRYPNGVMLPGAQRGVSQALRPDKRVGLVRQLRARMNKGTGNERCRSLPHRRPPRYLSSPLRTPSHRMLLHSLHRKRWRRKLRGALMGMGTQEMRPTQAACCVGAAANLPGLSTRISAASSSRAGRR